MIDTAECLWCANLHAHVKLFPNVEAGGHPFLRVDFHCFTTLESEANNDSAARQAEYIQAGRQ